MADSAFFCPLSHEGILAVRGSDAGKFLQGQLTCNINYLSQEHASLGARCTQKGRMQSSFRILLEGEMMALGRRPEVLLEVDGLNAILNLVKEGMGHAVLPSYTLSNFDNPETFTVQSIHSPRIMSQLMLVWSARRPTTQTQRKAMDVVSKVVLEAIHR